MVDERPLTAAEIYDQLTHGEGPENLADAGQSADDLSKRLHDRAEQITRLSVKTSAGWKGDAGDAATDATKALALASLDEGTQLGLARDAVTDQIDAFQRAKNSVKPVSPAKPELTDAHIAGMLTGAGPNYFTDLTRWQTDSQHNID